MDVIMWIILAALLIGLWFIGATVVNVIRAIFLGVPKLIMWLIRGGN